MSSSSSIVTRSKAPQKSEFPSSVPMESDGGEHLSGSRNEETGLSTSCPRDDNCKEKIEGFSQLILTRLDELTTAQAQSQKDFMEKVDQIIQDKLDQMHQSVVDDWREVEGVRNKHLQKFLEGQFERLASQTADGKPSVEREKGKRDSEEEKRIAFLKNVERKKSCKALLDKMRAEAKGTMKDCYVKVVTDMQESGAKLQKIIDDFA